VSPGRILLLCAVCLLTACDQAPQSGTVPVTSLSPAVPCDIRKGCRATADGLSVTVRFAASPRALRPFPVQVSIEGEQAAASVTVGFVMQGMDMGLNRYRLIAAAAHDWQADVTLPVCTSGRSDWLADVEVNAGGNIYRVTMPFVLEK